MSEADGEIYEFYWGTPGTKDFDRFLLKINSPREQVEKLLDDYREQNPDEYNDTGWFEFLKNKKIPVQWAEPEHEIYF